MAPVTNATVRDLAQHASVSIGTVSRVLNGKPGVRPDSLARVREAIDQLGYRRPATTVRRSRRTGNIGLFLVGQSHSWAQHPLYLAYLQGVSRACDESRAATPSTGFHPITEFCDDREGEIGLIAERKVDGLIIKGDPSGWLDTMPRSMPVVVLNAHDADWGGTYDEVRCDDYHAGYSVAKHLWDLGHRRIAFLLNDGQHPMLMTRLQGFEGFARLHGLLDPDLVSIEASYPRGSEPLATMPLFDEVVDRWWALPSDRRPTAIIAANDWSAAGLCRTLTSRGVRIPDEVSVVSFDNSIALCDGLDPRLTSHETPVEQAGYAAARLLIQRITQGETMGDPVVQLVRGRLVERESVAPPADARHRQEPAAGQDAASQMHRQGS